MLRTTLAAQFQNELGDPAVPTLGRTRLTSARLGYGTIGLAALMWLAAGPSYALWIWLTGWLGVAVVAVVGFRRVVRKATVFLGDPFTFRDLALMGAVVSGGTTKPQSPGSPPFRTTPRAETQDDE
jgi:hypothetical protein